MEVIPIICLHTYIEIKTSLPLMIFNTYCTTSYHQIIQVFHCTSFPSPIYNFEADLVFYLEEGSFVDVIIEAVCSSRRHHHREREVPGVA